jgi:chromosome segregation ATPase
MKEELLEELGKSRERILMIKQQYEHRLESLESKIKSLEVERDKALREGGNEHTSSSEIKRHYEAQIQEMEKSVKHLQNLLAQQKKALADQNKLETQLRRLKEELLELKRNKVSLCSLLDRKLVLIMKTEVEKISPETKPFNEFKK